MPGYNIYHNEFSHLLEKPPEGIPVELDHKLPTIARAGISIIFPAVKMDNFLQLITCELELKNDFLSTRQPVCYLRLRGFPLRQFTVEGLTELLFRLCSRYKILEAGQGERQIDLTLEQCTSNHLALLKGLGFNHIHILVDASIAGPDRSLDPVRKAVSTIRSFSGFAISGEILYNIDTSRDYLKNLVKYLFESRIDEIEFCRKHNTPAPLEELKRNHQTFKFMVETLNRAGYRLIGDRSFKHKDHPHFALLKNGKLGYGPWGFYNQSTTEWLGLGPGADGMIAGYLYHNSQNPADYENYVRQQRSPITSWSRHPMVEEIAFEFIQQMYCKHRVKTALFNGCLPLLKNLRNLNWVEETANYCKLTEEGILNLPTICNLYSLQPAVEHAS